MESGEVLTTFCLCHLVKALDPMAGSAGDCAGGHGKALASTWLSALSAGEREAASPGIASTEEMNAAWKETRIWLAITHPSCRKEAPADRKAGLCFDATDPISPKLRELAGTLRGAPRAHNDLNQGGAASHMGFAGWQKQPTRCQFHHLRNRTPAKTRPQPRPRGWHESCILITTTRI